MPYQLICCHHLNLDEFLHRDVRQLLFGEVQRVIDGSDSKLHGFGVWRQEGSQDGVIGHIHEGHHGVPAFVIVPHLTMERTRQWKVHY